MIISCPSCHKQYKLSSSILKDKNSQKVRCLDCKAIWVVEAPMQDVLQQLVTLQMKNPELTSFQAEKEENFIKKYKIDWVVLFLALFLLIFFLYKEKEYITYNLSFYLNHFYK